MELLLKNKKSAIRKSILIGILSFISTIAFTQSVFTVTKITDPDPFSYNNDDNLCSPEVFGTFQWAVRKVNDATTDSCLIVFDIPGSGPHVFEFIHQIPPISKRVKIDGFSQPTGKIILQFPYNININWLIWFRQSGANNSIIQGIHFSGLNDISWGTVGLQLNGANNVLVQNNIFTNVMQDMRISGSNNLIKSNLFGIDENGTSYPFFSGVVESIQIAYGGSNNTVSQNTITNHYNGVGIIDGVQNSVSQNRIYNNFSKCISSYSLAKPVISTISDLSNVVGTSLPGNIIELFGSTGPENANEYLTSVEADINGNWSVDLTGLTWPYVSATAYDNVNNTSPLAISNSACPVLSSIPCSPMDFTTTNWNVFAGDTIGFQNTSINCNNNYSVNWNFGDGSPIFGGDTTLSNVNPNHVFTSVGIFDVQLFSNNANGCRLQSVTKQITVNSTTKHLEFCHSNIACTNKDVTFENKSTGYSPSTNFLWDFGDGTGSTPTSIHTYSSSGTYTISLAGPDTAIVSTIYIFDDCLNPCEILPIVIASPSKDTICPGGAPAILTASGDATTYSWLPSEGLNATTGDTVMATPSITTTYTVTGTNAIGCENTDTITITVKNIIDNPDSTIWNGSLNSDWFVTCNWDGGLPSSTKNVIIPSGLINYPEISKIGLAECKSIISDSATTLTITNSKNLNVYGDWIQSGELLSSGGSVTLKGIGIQNISYVERFDTSNVILDTLNILTVFDYLDSLRQNLFAFNTLIIDKDAGGTSLNYPLTVIDSLILNQGVIVTNYNIINFLDNSIAINGSDSSYVSGLIVKEGNDAFTFPLGDVSLDSGAYHPLSISPPADVLDRYMARYIAKGDKANYVVNYIDTLGNYTLEIPLEVDSLESISDCEHWDLYRERGTSIVVPSVTWNTNSCNVADLESLRIAAWDSVMWVSLGNAGLEINGDVGTITAERGLDEYSVSIVIAQFGGFLLNTTDLVNNLKRNDTASTGSITAFESLFGPLPVDTIAIPDVIPDTLMYVISGAEGISGTYKAGSTVNFSNVKIGDELKTITIAFYNKLVLPDTLETEDTVKILFDLDKYYKASNVRMAYKETIIVTPLKETEEIDSIIINDPLFAFSDSVKAFLNTENNYSSTEPVEVVIDTVVLMDSAFYDIANKSLVLLSGLNKQGERKLDSLSPPPFFVDLEGGILFSPNNDGISDTFQISFNVEIPVDFYLKIYDVNNVSIFETDIATSFWDGKDSNGTLVSSGNYYYQITAYSQSVNGQFLVEY